MIRLTRSQLQPIGLDIGRDSIKMLQLEVVGNHLSVAAAARMPMPPEARQDAQLRLAVATDLVRRMLRQGGFRGRRVVAAVPRELLAVKNVRLPQMPLNELESAIGFEARNILPFAPEEGMIHCLPAGEVRQGLDVKQEAIVLGARRDQIDDFLERMHRIGVIVAALDVEACALFRTVERFIRRREDEQDVHVLLDIGAQRTGVVIGKGREISFIKPIEIGADDVTAAVAGKLDVSFEEAAALRQRLIEEVEPGDGARLDSVRQAVTDAARPALQNLGRELSLCLRYYTVTFRGQRPAKVRLLGGGAGDPQVQASLASALAVPIEQGRPLFSVDTARMKPADRRGTMGQWALAFGLALKCTSGTFAPRDGRPRDPNDPRPDLEAPTAQVIDLGEALQQSAGAPVEPTARDRRQGAGVGPAIAEAHHA